MVEWGPTGELVYNRTYSRTKPDGSKETWPETVRRVVEGNISLAPDTLVPNEKERLIEMIQSFKILPGGRHLWASGVKGRQYLFNCHVSGWGEDLTDHFRFSFMRLMEGGGVGANYSNKHLAGIGPAKGHFNVHIVCDPSHPDYQEMKEAGALSTEYGADWEGSFAVEDSREGWADALVDLLQTYYRDAKNVNRVFDVSRVRGKGSRLQTFGGSASGPLPLAFMLREVSWTMNSHSGIPLTGMGAMEIDHAIAKCVVSGGNRRSARMSIMEWDDPEIFTFLQCKGDTGQHWTTNISVEVDERFWDSVDADTDSERMGHARMVLHGIAQGMLTNGEPGIWNSDLSNRGEPGEVIATNPCGEIPLEAWENCNLGHVNLSAFINDESAEVQADELAAAHVLMTRFLIRATFGDVNDEKQAEALARNRRIGVGHFGFASAIAKLGYRYSEIAYAPEMKELLTQLSELVDRVSVEYAHVLRIPVPVKKRTIAPTGTIAKMPGVSEGIHPIFSQYFIRRIRLSTVDPAQLDMIEDYRRQGYHVEPCRYASHTMVIEIPTKDSLLEEVSSLHGAEVAHEIVESAEDLTLVNMLAVQELYQEYWADNAVSFTANVDPEKFQVGQLMTVLDLFSGSLKGATIFPELSREQAPYERISKEEFEASSFGAIADSVDEECMSGACPVR